MNFASAGPWASSLALTRWTTLQPDSLTLTADADSLTNGRGGLALLTPEKPADRGPLVMVRSTDAPKLVEALAREGILCSTRDGSIRVSLHYYNTDGDVDMVLAAMDRHPDLLVRAPN